MGENVLHIFAKQSGLRDECGVFCQYRFPQSLPNVPSGSSAKGGLALTSYIYIGKAAGLDGQFLLLYGQQVDASCAEGIASLLQGADDTLG